MGVGVGKAVDSDVEVGADVTVGANGLCVGVTEGCIVVEHETNILEKITANAKQVLYFIVNLLMWRTRSTEWVVDKPTNK